MALAVVDVPSGLAPVSASAPVGGGADIADQPRCPFPCLPFGSALLPPTTAEIPQVQGKWWSPGLIVVRPKYANAYNHVVRIMESDLGERAERRYAHCVENGWECWRYNDAAGKNIARKGSACARCRITDKKCDISTRTPKKALPILLPGYGLRTLTPGPLPLLPPPAGGAAAIAA